MIYPYSRFPSFHSITLVLHQQVNTLFIYTPVLITAFIIISCSLYTDPFQSTERAIYPSECDFSPIELGTLKIYNTDSSFLYSIDLDHQYTHSSTIYIDLENATYLFKLHSEYTDQTANFKISIQMKTTNVNLNICDGL